MDIKNKKLFLFDIDGTVSIGEKFIPGGKELLRFIKSSGREYIFITNNSTKSTESYIEKFRKMGFETKPENFVTAATAAVRYIKQVYKNKKIFVVGTKSFVKELIKNKINAVETYGSDVDCVLIGFDNELNYGKIETACRILSEQKADFVATNPDLVCPAPFGFIPDCGSICQMISNAVKRKPFYIGKPESLIIDMCLETTGISKHETVIIGDRLYTDILSGIKSGVDTIAVLTGETDTEEISHSDYKPDEVFDSVKEILEKLRK